MRTAEFKTIEQQETLLPVSREANSKSDYFRNAFERILKKTDIQINGERAWDIQVHHEGFFRKVVMQGSLGLGEAYMDRWWDCEALDQLFYKLSLAEMAGDLQYPWYFNLHILKGMFLNLQVKKRAFKNVEHHYDIGNDLYERMLDKRMVYSCAHWKNARNLDEAQEAKLEMICQKAGLKAGMRILDIGCGWGSFVQYAVEHYNVRAVGITVSQEQFTLARKRCFGLPIEIRLQDYRDLDEQFDRIISIGMFEHVGSKNYRSYMEVVHACLKNEGLFVLQTIGGNQDSIAFDPWLDRYIFPGASIPSMGQIATSIKGLFIMQEWQNAAGDYDKTLIAWFHNIIDQWPCLKEKYDRRFYRMWEYYLLSCAGLFRSHKQQLWRIVLSKPTTALEIC